MKAGELMAINLQVNTAISIDEPVTMQELQAAVKRCKKETDEPKQELSKQSQDSVAVNAQVKARDIKLYKTVSDNKAVIRDIQSVESAKKSKYKSKAERDEAFEKVLKGNKVRKYTKEMQNRDAIAKQSKAMRKKARKTASNYDDKFAEEAATPTKQFDNIIYGSATTGDAENMLDSAFSDIMDAVK